MANNAADANPGAKLATALDPILTAQFAKAIITIQQSIVAQAADLKVYIGTLDARMKTVEQLLATEKTSKSAGKRKAKGDETAPADPAPAGGVAPATAPAAAAPLLGTTAYAAFLKRFTTEPEYRAPYITEFGAEMETVEDIKKKVGDKKLTPQGRWVWSKLKETKDARYTKMESDFKAAKPPKKEPEKPVQQKEEVTPPVEKK